MKLLKFINQLETQYSFFNNKPLSFEDLLIWAENLDIICLPDKRISSALSFISRYGDKIILYNPELHPDHLTLAIGHELGHWLLGHVECGEMLYNPYGYFCTSGIEKDAGIIGFLCWFPTWRLERVLRQRGYLDPEELACENSTCDTEWSLLVKLFHARAKIFRAWRRLIYDENP